MSSDKGGCDSPSEKAPKRADLSYSRAQLDDIEALLRDIERSDADYHHSVLDTPSQRSCPPQPRSADRTRTAKTESDAIHEARVRNAAAYREMQRAEVVRSMQARKEFRKMHSRTPLHHASAAKEQQQSQESACEKPATAPAFRVHAQTLESFIVGQLGPR